MYGCSDVYLLNRIFIMRMDWNIVVTMIAMETNMVEIKTVEMIIVVYKT